MDALRKSVKGKSAATGDRRKPARGGRRATKKASRATARHRKAS
jgi:hypothetical protein